MSAPIGPLFKVSSTEYVEVFAVKQKKFNSALKDVVHHFRVIKTNSSKLKTIFPDEKEDAQNFLLGFSDDYLSSDGTRKALQKDETKEDKSDELEGREDGTQKSDEIANLKRELEYKNERLQKLRAELISMTS